MTTWAVQAEGLTKRYGQVRALDGLDLEIAPGTVTGVLGPNGAGKTTTVRVLATLLRPDAGSARVAGHDVLRDPDAVRRTIGLAGQYAAVDENLTGEENLRLLARLHLLSPADARARAAGLLEQFDLVAVIQFAEKITIQRGGLSDTQYISDDTSLLPDGAIRVFRWDRICFSVAILRRHRCRGHVRCSCTGEG